MQSKHNRNISEQNAPILYRDTQLSENHQEKHSVIPESCLI